MSKPLDGIQGQCLCGSVTFTLSGEASSFHLCYCARCRHATGTAHAANIFAKPENITWHSGQDNMQRYEHAEAKSFAKQFCKTCGSALPYTNRAATHLVIPAGTLNTDIEFEPDDRIFCASRAKWAESIPNKIEFPDYPETF